MSAWVSRCPNCRQFGTIQKKDIVSQEKTVPVNTPHLLSEVSVDEGERILTYVSEFDSVVGGLVSGQVVLLYASPGVGKSTLAGQLCEASGRSAVYVSAEESLSQVALRHRRIGVGENTRILSTRFWGDVESLTCDLLVVDSLQTMVTGVDSRAGSRSQMESVMLKICEKAKTQNIPVLVICQVTKEGEASGPNSVAHMCDTILSLESSPSSPLIFLHCDKNRYNSTEGVGIFAHTSRGLIEVPNPEDYLVGAHTGPVCGVARTVVTDSGRSMAVEVQALVTPSSSTPMRVAEGVKRSRLNQVLAVLEYYGNVSFEGLDVFVTTVGGVELERRSDAAVALALVSSLKRRSFDLPPIISGEVFLTGEILELNPKRINSYARKIGNPVKSVRTIQELVEL